MQKTGNNIYHCRVCNIDIDDYFVHLGLPEHHKNYMNEFDHEDGKPIVLKIDQMFDELKKNIP